MTRRDAVFTFAGSGGVMAFLTGCDMDAVQRAEAQLGDRMTKPGTGVQFSGLPDVVKVIVLASYPATPQQVQVAEQRARKAAVVVQKRRATSSSSGGGGAASKKAPPAPPAIVAVETSAGNSQQGEKSIMLWNTRTESFVSNKVYDIQKAPDKNDIALVAGTTALYVGNGAL
ncbi:MAG: hypothetical protein IT576_17840 [Verrucomicrobiales bacterium]|nr:hypothetical protein [Verrucomicrobiales bacterium]